MRAPEALNGTRIIGPPSVLDAIPVPAIPQAALRLAPDDLVLFLDRGNYKYLGPEPTIQDEEAGFVGWWLTPDELEHVRRHVDWPLIPGLNQGLVAGVPAKVWLGPDRSLLLVARAYAHELETRL